MLLGCRQLVLTVVRFSNCSLNQPSETQKRDVCHCHANDTDQLVGRRCGSFYMFTLTFERPAPHSQTHSVIVFTKAMFPLHLPKMCLHFPPRYMVTSSTRVQRLSSVQTRQRQRNFRSRLGALVTRSRWQRRCVDARASLMAQASYKLLS